MAESARHLEDTSLLNVASHYLARIAKGHPFTDGNKRTGYFAARYFLMRNGADFNGTSPEIASQEIESIAAQPSMEDASQLARTICGRYIINNQLRIPDYETFYRVVIKSIGVASILAKK